MEHKLTLKERNEQSQKFINIVETHKAMYKDAVCFFFGQHIKVGSHSLVK